MRQNSKIIEIDIFANIYDSKQKENEFGVLMKLVSKKEKTKIIE